MCFSSLDGEVSEMLGDIQAADVAHLQACLDYRMSKHSVRWMHTSEVPIFGVRWAWVKSLLLELVNSSFN